MINLLNNKDFIMGIENESALSIYFTGKINFSKTLRNKLTVAAEKNELVNTQGLRGIGKTFALVKFAEINNYVALLSSKYSVENVKRVNSYNLIYSCDLNEIRGIQNKNVIIDENVTNIQELKDNGFNIITGYYTEMGINKNKCFFENTVETLKNEIECLIPKIQKTRENRDYGTYKNLILAYKEVIQLIKYCDVKE